MESEVKGENGVVERRVGGERMEDICVEIEGLVDGRVKLEKMHPIIDPRWGEV